MSGGLDWPGVIQGLVNLGFAGLVGWYLLTKALPKMQDLYLQSQEKQQKEFLSSQLLQREQYLLSSKEQREHFLNNLEAYRTWFDVRETRAQAEAKSALTAVIGHCEREAARRDETLRSELGVVNNALTNLMVAIEEWREERRQDRHQDRHQNRQDRKEGQA